MTPTFGSEIRRSVPLLFCALFFLAVQSILAAEAVKSFDVPAGDAIATLKQAAQQGGVEIMFPADTVKDVKTAAVKGELTPRAALDKMLDGTGLVAVQDEKTGALAVKKGPLPNDPRVAQKASDRPTRTTQGADDVVKLETYKVEGQRAGQAKALNRQRDAGNLKNIVTSDTLGRFPDQNAAESLQRIPGVALERDQGEGRFITVRGLDPDLNNTQLNGISLPAAGGIEEGARKVNLDLIASELIESIEVTKAVTPDMDGDAIGGSVNLISQTAFSQEGRLLRVSAEGQYGELTGDWGRKFSASYADRFMDGKLGLLLSYSDAQRDFGSDNRELTDTAWAPKNGFLVPGSDVQYREYEIGRERRGASFSLDYRPTGDDEFFVRGMHNYFSDFENRYRTRFRGTPATTTPASDLVGTVANRPVEVNLKDRFDESYLWSLSAGGEHRRGANSFDYKVAHSYSETSTRNRSDSTFRSPNTSWTYDFADELRPVITGAALSLPASAFAFNNIIFDNNRNQDEESSAMANFRHEMDIAGQPGFVKFGAKYRTKEKNIDFNLATYANASGGAFTLANVVRTSARGVTPAFPSINPGAERAWFAANPGHFALNSATTTLNSTINDYISREEVLAAYGMASVTRGPLTAIGGIRMENTRFSTKGWEIQGANVATLARTSASNDYTEILPGLVLRYNLRPNLVARASWTSTMARPKFSDSNLSRVIDTDGNITQGNPALKPYRARNWDASIEFYPKAVGVFTVGVFRKEIDDFVFTQTLTGGAPNGLNDLSLPLNGESAVINGIEADWQYQLTGMPAPFDGFGFSANYTLTESKAQPGAARPGETVPFLGQSDRIYNVALTYERDGIFLRLAANYRSDYLLLLGGARASDIYVREHFQLDASASYTISERVTLFAEAQNLTDEPLYTSFDVSQRLRQAEFYSWSANVGVKLSF